jgi:hypothetical protein
MKTKKVELDVDFIGGQTSLTKEEEKTISEYIKKNKSKRSKSTSLKAKTIKQLI